MFQCDSAQERDEVRSIVLSCETTFAVSKILKQGEYFLNIYPFIFLPRTYKMKEKTPIFVLNEKISRVARDIWRTQEILLSLSTLPRRDDELSVEYEREIPRAIPACLLLALSTAVSNSCANAVKKSSYH